MPLIRELRPNAKKTNSRADFGYDFFQASQNFRGLIQHEQAQLAKYNVSPELSAQGAWHYHSYVGSADAMPVDVSLPEASFASVMLHRRSVREFSPRPVQFQDLAKLLRLSYSYSSHGFSSAPDEPLRTTPSGGARFPIEVYVNVKNVSGLAAGIYHYNIRDFSLSKIAEGDKVVPLLKATSVKDHQYENCSFQIILTAVFARTILKYGLRGWRIIFLDAGHLGQSLWLSATALGLGCYASSGGLEKEISPLLQLNPSQEGYILSYVFGNPPGDDHNKT